MSNEWIPEQLPEDIDAERALLATCCAPGAEHAAADIAFSMTAEDFVSPVHRRVFAAMKALIERGEEVNALSLKDTLDQSGDLGRVGGYAGLVELLSGEEVARPKALADILTRKHKFRRLIRLGAAMVRQASQEDEQVDSLVVNAMQDLTGIISTGRKDLKWRKAGDSIMETLQTKGFFTEDPKATGRSGRLNIGVPTLTQHLKRLAGNMVVFGARPKCGKTTLMVQSAFAMASEGDDVAIATLEMTEDELHVVLTAHALRAEQDRVARGELTSNEWALLVEIQPILDRIHILAIDPDTPWALIETQLRQVIATTGCTVVYLDYFGLVGKPSGEFFNEAARSAALSRRMKAFPKTTGATFVVLVQINREIGDSGEPAPQHIRDSGQIEQDMAVGIFLWREPTKDMLRMERGEKWDYHIKIDFNRFGLGYLRVAYDLLGNIARIREVERSTEAQATVGKRTHREQPRLEL